MGVTMARSFKTYKFTNNTGQAVNDLHITWGLAGIEVIAVDGKKPDDKDAEYTLTDTGGEADISDHDVQNNGEVKVRIKTANRRPPQRVTYYWTKDGTRVGEVLRLAGIIPVPDEIPDEVAFRRFEERMDFLSDRLDMLIEMNRFR